MKESLIVFMWGILTIDFINLVYSMISNTEVYVGAITLGIICGLAFGILDVLIMIPLKVENRRKKVEAMVGAFIERFMLGFLIPNTDLGTHYVLTGIILGLGLSVPTAIITRAYIPIIAIGVVGGVIIGIITNAIL